MFKDIVALVCHDVDIIRSSVIFFRDEDFFLYCITIDILFECLVTQSLAFQVLVLHLLKIWIPQLRIFGSVGRCYLRIFTPYVCIDGISNHLKFRLGPKYFIVIVRCQLFSVSFIELRFCRYIYYISPWLAYYLRQTATGVECPWIT